MTGVWNTLSLNSDFEVEQILSRSISKQNLGCSSPYIKTGFVIVTSYLPMNKTNGKKAAFHLICNFTFRDFTQIFFQCLIFDVR